MSLQVKPTVVEIKDEPHLVVVASTTIEPGDELLFDYNDRKSRLPFLKKCPVCGVNDSDNASAPQGDADDADDENGVKPDNEPSLPSVTTKVKSKRRRQALQDDDDMSDVEPDDEPSSPPKTKKPKTERRRQASKSAEQPRVD